MSSRINFRREFLQSLEAGAHMAFRNRKDDDKVVPIPEPEPLLFQRACARASASSGFAGATPLKLGSGASYYVRPVRPRKVHQPLKTPTQSKPRVGNYQLKLEHLRNRFLPTADDLLRKCSPVDLPQKLKVIWTKLSHEFDAIFAYTRDASWQRKTQTDDFDEGPGAGTIYKTKDFGHGVEIRSEFDLGLNRPNYFISQHDGNRVSRLRMRATRNLELGDGNDVCRDSGIGVSYNAKDKLEGIGINLAHGFEDHDFDMLLYQPASAPAIKDAQIASYKHLSMSDLMNMSSIKEMRMKLLEQVRILQKHSGISVENGSSLFHPTTGREIFINKQTNGDTEIWTFSYPVSRRKSPYILTFSKTKQRAAIYSYDMSLDDRDSNFVLNYSQNDGDNYPATMSLDVRDA